MLHVNGLRLVSEFSTALFADNTYLALSDRSLVSLETKVNAQSHNFKISFGLEEINYPRIIQKRLICYAVNILTNQLKPSSR